MVVRVLVVSPPGVVADCVLWLLANAQPQKTVSKHLSLSQEKIQFKKSTISEFISLSYHHKSNHGKSENICIDFSDHFPMRILLCI